MISSIFGKTKPINYIIVLTFLFFLYWFTHLFLFKKTYSSQELSITAAVSCVLLISVFGVNFIVKKNKITETNSLAMLFYAALIILFAEVLVDRNAILCSFFLLLSQRKLISLKSLKNNKFKIFDATFWIAIASLFYDWALLYILLVFVAIYLHESDNIRNWLVPFVAIFTVFVISFCILLLFGKLSFLKEHYVFNNSFNIEYFSLRENSSRHIIYIIMNVFLSIITFIKFNKSGFGKISSIRLITFSYILGIIVTMLKTTNSVFPILITFFPAVVFLTNYIEVIKKPKFKEVLLIIAVLIPVIVLVNRTF